MERNKLIMRERERERERGERERERERGGERYLITQHILFTVIWRRTYGEGPLR